MSRTATKETARTSGKWQGMNWIRQEKRLAIYLRDGLACVYCARGVESGTALALDHIKPHSKGGSNHESNLVTCCGHCNSSRADRPLATFAAKVAGYVNHGETAKNIVARVNRNSARVLKPYIAEAKELISRRGGLQNVLNA